MNPRRKRTGVLAIGLGAIAASGCGNAKPVEKPPEAAPPPALQMVEADAPFVVDWDSRQAASLAEALRSPNKGAIVVSVDPQRGTIRVLPDCHLSGVYVPSGIGMYRGMLQVRRFDARKVTQGLRQDALQQIATSTNVPGGKLLDYRFVVVGRHGLGASRTTARLTDLSGKTARACEGATHFVRAGLTGAFERVLGPEAQLEARTLPDAGASALPMHSGDFTQCLTAGTAGSPACSAFLKIELTALDTSPSAAIASSQGPSPLLAPTPSGPVQPAATSVHPGSAAPAGTGTQTGTLPAPIIAVPQAPTSTAPVLIPVPKPPPPAASATPTTAPSTSPTAAPSTNPTAAPKTMP